MQSYTVFDFVLGESDEDSEASWQIDGLGPCPEVGQTINLWSTRDDNGNYVNRDSKEKFKCVVIRVEHIFEERGMDAQHNHWVHFVEIFMKSVK